MDVPSFDLTDKIAIVTGPAKGMGRSITLALADAGAHLMLAGRDLDAIEPVAAEVVARGRRCEIAACDVTNEAEVAATVAATRAALGGRIDILVNVAGGSGPLGKRFWDTTPEEFEDILRLNVTGCFLTMRAVMPVMMAQKYGKIVNIGGTFGLRGRIGRSAYSASKWGLRGITKSAALEAGPFNVNVNNVCPGMVDGPRFDRVCTELATAHGISLEAARTRHAEEYALRRISTANDIADAVLFFASDRSRQITGQDLAVDGGWAI